MDILESIEISLKDTRFHWWLVYIGSANGTKPLFEPMLTYISVNMVSRGHTELNENNYHTPSSLPDSTHLLIKHHTQSGVNP